MSRYKKLFDYLETELNAIALESNLMEIEDIVKEMMVEDKPEPLDPHTCELCVGDVVEDMDTGYDFLIADIHDNDARTYFGINLVNYSIEVLFRTDLTLKSNQRAGVQIGE